MQFLKNILPNVYKLIFLVPLVFFPPLFNQFELAKQIYLFVILGFWLLLAGYFLMQKKKLEFEIPKIFGLFLILISISFLVSTIFSISPFESLVGGYSNFQGLITHFLYLVNLIVVFYLVDKKFLDSVLHITVAIGSIVSIYAVLQKIGIDPLGQDALGNFSGRSSSFLGQPNLLGQFLIYPILILFNGILYKKGNLILNSGLLVLNVSALVFSYNRASILAVLIGVAVLVLYRLKSKKLKIVAVLSGLAIFFVVLFLLINNNFRSLGSRSVVWQSAIKSVQENLWIGGGPETSYMPLQKNASTDIYKYERMFSIIGKAHNETFEILLTRGILGFVPYLIYIFFILYSFILKLDFKDRLLSVILLSALITNQFSFSNSAHIIFLSFFAISLLKSESYKKILLTFKFKFSPIYLVILTSVIGLSFLFIGLRTTQTEIIFDSTTMEYFRGLESKAVNGYEKVQKMNPFVAEYYRIPIMFLHNDEEYREKVEKWLDKYSKTTGDNFRADLYRAEFDTPNYQTHTQNALAKVPDFPLAYQINAENSYRNGEYEFFKQNILKLLPYVEDYESWTEDKIRIFRKDHPRFFGSLYDLYLLYEKEEDQKNAQKLLELLDVFDSTLAGLY